MYVFRKQNKDLYLLPTEIKYIHEQTLIKLAKANISLWYLLSLFRRLLKVAIFPIN